MKKMKTHLLIVTLLVYSNTISAQNDIEWDSNYELVFSDFQSSGSQIGGDLYSLNVSAGTYFSFTMSNYEFMFTKNFNDLVSTTFKRNSSSLIAPDQQAADKMLKFAQFDFDLIEMFSRKFRKRLYEEKGTFSNISFIQPIYDEMQKEYIAQHDEIAKITSLGKDDVKLNVAHAIVLKEIEELAAYCKFCKPSKKAKVKN